MNGNAKEGLDDIFLGVKTHYKGTILSKKMYFFLKYILYYFGAIFLKFHLAF
jgi:hypothetical protein